MLKLLKYEWKACARACMPVYIAALLMALLNRLMDMEGLLQRLSEFALFNIIRTIAALGYAGVLAAVVVVTTVILIQRFYKNLLGDEGYLMFTLPVTPAQHIWSKTIVACVMQALSMIVMFLSIMILASGVSMFGQIKMVFESIFGAIVEYPAGILYGLEGLLFVILLAVGGTLFCYLCMAVGHLAKKHRILMSVVWYFVLSTVLEILFVLFIFVVDETSFYQVINSLTANWTPEFGMHMLMILLCLGTAAVTAVFFAGTNYILKRKLNLE